MTTHYFDAVYLLVGFIWSKSSNYNSINILRPTVGFLELKKKNKSYEIAIVIIIQQNI